MLFIVLSPSYSIVKKLKTIIRYVGTHTIPLSEEIVITLSKLLLLLVFFRNTKFCSIFHFNKVNFIRIPCLGEAEVP
jgi:hypothetical protein